MEDLIAVVYALYGVAFVAGIPLAIWRSRRDKSRQGRLSLDDGQRLKLPQPTPSERLHLVVGHERTGPGRTRITISGIDLARELGFRLEGKTERTSSGLAGRLVVEGTKGSRKARQLFARGDVNDAVALVCGAGAGFKRIDLFPDGGDLAVVVDADHAVELDDVTERLLRFALALDHALPSLSDDDVDLGATSGTASSAAFSIEIRS